MKMKLLLAVLGILLAVPITAGWKNAQKKENSAEAAQIATKIAERLNKDLAELGIDGAELVKEAAKHPLKIRIAVPEHKRKRFIVFTKEHEKKITDSAIADMQKGGKLYSDKDDEARVRPIAEKIIAVLPEKVTLRLYLVADDSVNAGCFPDGTVIVNRGTLKKIKNDDQLAAILAHEYGHAVARHGAENLTKMLMQSAGEVYVTEKVKNSSANDIIPGKLVKAGYGLCAGLGFRLPYSRTMEYEADKLGIIYMKKAGYDPQAAIDLFNYFEELAPSEKDEMLQYFSSHPQNSQRIEHIKNVIQEIK